MGEKAKWERVKVKLYSCVAFMKPKGATGISSTGCYQWFDERPVAVKL